jgi:hypothetical protein
MFDQPDLGYARDDPELYEDKWHALENRVFDFLDSGHPQNAPSAQVRNGSLADMAPALPIFRFTPESGH